MNFRRIISAVAAGAMIFSSSAFPAFAQSYGDGKNIMILGDSIASGYGLSEKDYTYGEIIADYIGGTVENYAVSGYTSSETLEQIRNFDESQKEQLSKSDIVVISTGGNDMMRYASRSLLDFAANEGLLVDGKTSADLPEKPTLNDVKELIDRTAVEEYVGNFTNVRNFNDKIDSIYRNITYTDANIGGSSYAQIIAKQIIPNIQAMAEEIRNLNPNAEIIVQTIYNPMQFEKTYEDEMKLSFSPSYLTAYLKVKTIFNQTTIKFADQVKNTEGIKIADILTDFSSTDDNSQSYCWYFTKMQEDEENMDFHPNQAGHLAIAANVLNLLGETAEDGGLLRKTYKILENRDNYPSYALAELEKVEGEYSLGDVDDDGIINSNDATIVLEQYSIKQTEGNLSLPESQIKACNINGDIIIDSLDATDILSYYAFNSTGGKSSVKQFFLG